MEMEKNYNIASQVTRGYYNSHSNLMQFSSFWFFLLFFTCALLCGLFPSARKAVLLIASLLFCVSFSLATLLVFSGLILLNCLVALGIERLRYKEILFLPGIAANLIALAFFKYSGFFFGVENFIFAPIGISFLMLQLIGYLIEVRQGRYGAERQLDTLGLYFFFFPKLVSGPIERPQHLIPQLAKPWVHNETETIKGLQRIAWGFFKKLVVADRLAPLVQNVYSSPFQFQDSQLLVGTFIFSLQIYFDFAGYTDIAIGVAQVFGIKLTENFKQPYFSVSVTEFWQRWHISFSNWLRDYVYFPLARKIGSAKWRWAAIVLTFLISGLWHGVGWTFVIWGLLHGLYLAVESAFGVRTSPSSIIPNRITQVIKATITLMAVSIAWVFFRAETVPDALFILAQLPSGLLQLIYHLADLEYLKNSMLGIGFGLTDILVLAPALMVLLVADILQTKASLREYVSRQPALIRWATYYALILVIFAFGVFGGSSFIYFQF